MALIESQSTEIAAEAESVWNVITDIRHAANVISGIKEIQILEEAAGPHFVGLKWKETREWMGKDAVEVMWITDACAPTFYETRAESHGSVYQSRFELEPTECGTRLTMQFNCRPETIGARIMWILMGWMAKRSLRKVIAQDLKDVKSAVENAQ
ncbi:MAG: SRPBCC family protein [Akkermansiaceae bacterium]|nr:SRPBCC family protein [Akkermansiaceae bacterium]